jgi:hypothetical protein
VTVYKLNSSSWASFRVDRGTTLGVSVSYFTLNDFSSFRGIAMNIVSRYSESRTTSSRLTIPERDFWLKLPLDD